MDADRHVDRVGANASRRPARDLAWRRRLLRAAGMPEELSRAAAASDAYDVNGLVALLEQGCLPATALHIAKRFDRLEVA
jgi:hypothetical protein